MTDLSELLFPSDMGVSGRLCMIYNCFLDDSKDQAQEQMVISAGFFAPDKQVWQHLRLAWKECLQRHGLCYFKTSEWKMLRGEFEKYKSADYPPPTGREAANRVREELHQILERAKFVNGLGMAVPVADFNEVRDMLKGEATLEGSLYHWAFVHVVTETMRAVRKFPGKNMVAFVHDDGNDFTELFGVYKGFMEKNPHFAKYSGGFQPLDDKKHPELQAADMAANYALQLGMKWLSSGRQKQEQEQFQKSIKRLFVMDKIALLRTLRDQYRHQKLALPPVLQNL